jgi:hypothetical protein
LPSKDIEVRRATARRFYARNREKVIAAVKARKHDQYAGVCRFCGGPTVGNSGPGSAPDSCGKCRSQARKGRLFR